METICEFLKYDHQQCDDLFYETETRVAQRNWEAATGSFRRFADLLGQHIRMEEKILLPAFRQAMPESAGPADMLHGEHLQIHGIMDRMGKAILRCDATDYVLHAETLTMLLQQHTLKEEEMLYPLLDKALACRRSIIIAAMSEHLAATLTSA